MNSDSEIKKFLLSHKKVKKPVLLDIIRSKANPYPQLKGYSTKTKGELIDLILENKNIFKTFLSKGIQNLKGSLPKDKIQDKPIKSPPKKSAEKPAQKSVDKQETKKEQPVKKAVTKTAKKSDVQGVTSKKSVVDQILDIVKNGKKKDAKKIIDVITDLYYDNFTDLFQGGIGIYDQLKYMDKKNSNLSKEIYKPKNFLRVMEDQNKNNTPLIQEINKNSDYETNDDGTIAELLQKLKPKKKK